MTITFRQKTGNEDLDSLNSLLYKNSKGRYELCRTKDLLKWYMKDYDENGRNRVIRNYAEIDDILQCMNIYVIGMFKAIKIKWRKVEENN